MTNGSDARRGCSKVITHPKSPSLRRPGFVPLTYLRVRMITILYYTRNPNLVMHAQWRGTLSLVRVGVHSLVFVSRVS